MLNSIDISYLLVRVKDHSLLDGDKIILGINTLWSTLLPVAIGILVPTMQVCLKYIAICYYGFMPAIWIYTVY